MANETKIDIRSVIDAKLAEDAARRMDRILEELEETLREAGSSFSPQDLTEAALVEPRLDEIAKNIIRSYELLLANDAYAEDGDLPIRFVDHAHGEVCRLWTNVLNELGKDTLNVKPLQVEKPTVSRKERTEGDVKGVSAGNVCGIVAGVVAIGVVAGVLVTLKKRRDKSEDGVEDEFSETASFEEDTDGSDDTEENA